MLGTWSYGIYVWHIFPRRIMLAVYERLPVASPAVSAFEWLAYLCVGVLISVACGWVSYVVLEEPFLRLKRLFRYERPVEARRVEGGAGVGAEITEPLGLSTQTARPAATSL